MILYILVHAVLQRILAKAHKPPDTSKHDNINKHKSESKMTCLHGYSLVTFHTISRELSISKIYWNRNLVKKIHTCQIYIYVNLMARHQHHFHCKCHIFPPHTFTSPWCIPPYGDPALLHPEARFDGPHVPSWHSEGRKERGNCGEASDQSLSLLIMRGLPCLTSLLVSLPHAKQMSSAPDDKLHPGAPAKFIITGSGGEGGSFNDFNIMTEL